PFFGPAAGLARERGAPPPRSRPLAVVHAEIAGGVPPAAHVAEAGALEHRREFIRRVFVGILGVDALAGRERARDAVDDDRLARARLEMHFDARIPLIVE